MALCRTGCPNVGGDRMSEADLAARQCKQEVCLPAGQDVIRPASDVLSLASFVGLMHSTHWPDPDRRGELCSDGLVLRYEVFGEDGPLLVFVPGVGFARDGFRPIASSLRARFRSVLLDPRGVGASDGPAEDSGYSIVSMSRDQIGRASCRE